jgi:hypothetical protein
VVSQPCNRNAIVPVPGRLDSKLGEFWVGNPWQIVAFGHNLSAFERNRAFWNVQGEHFLEISYLTGADHDGDSRSVVAADFRHVGQIDLVVRQAGGGPLLYYENQMPRRNFLTVSLRAQGANRRGIGARLTATVGGRSLVRELYPANSFMSQAPAMVHFGLGDAPTVERLVIRWPSGKIQELRQLSANRHIVITEGESEDAATVQDVVPGRVIEP